MADLQPSPERWLPVVGYEGFYEVSDHGRVRSVDRTVKFRDGRVFSYTSQLRSQTPQVPYGHMAVGLKRKGKRRTVRVHRLVLEAFVGPCPPGMEGCHNDGNPANNHVSNLRWDTSSANKQDVLRHGRHHCANRTHCPYGHPLQEPNLVPSGQGRQCLACSRARAYMQRNPDQRSRYQQIADDYFSKIVA